MDSTPQRESRVLWSFWLACGLAATAAIAPLLLTAGSSSRISGGAIPFGIGAIALAVNALSYPRGRPLATSLYVLAWIAIVYGILRMVAVPLLLAVVGTCPAAVEGCTPGLSGPLSGNEGTGIGIGIVLGALALQIGFFGLRILYRGARKAPAATREPAAAAPAPVVASAETPLPSAAPAPAPVAEPMASSAATGEAPAHDRPASVAGTNPARKPRTKRQPKQAADGSPPSEQAELPAHAEQAELPAPAEQAELPAPAEQAELPPHSTTTEPSDTTSSS